MLDREEVISHLQIISTWAGFAQEFPNKFIFTDKHLQNIVEWTEDAVELIKGVKKEDDKKEIYPSAYGERFSTE